MTEVSVRSSKQQSPGPLPPRPGARADAQEDKFSETSHRSGRFPEEFLMDGSLEVSLHSKSYCSAEGTPGPQGTPAQDGLDFRPFSNPVATSQVGLLVTWSVTGPH